MDTMTPKAETTGENFVVENYLGMMRRLKREDKARIAARLTEELAGEEAAPDPSREMDEVDRLCGSWKGDESVEEIIAMIYEGRQAPARGGELTDAAGGRYD